MTCRYCQTIHSFDESYPMRQATRDVKSEYPRCDWHWRFVCNICGKPRHFNGTTWCEKTHKFICINCAKSHKLVRRKFWNWKSYYALKCDACSEHHPALDHLEFSGKHPWQLHSTMQTKKEGLSHETELQKTTSIYVPLKEGVVSEKQISQAWNRVANNWAGGYAVFGDFNRKYVVDPVLFRLAGSVKGSTILDAGCGNGYLCRLLAKKGAKMVGIDISNKFIKIARQKEKETPLGIDYYEGSICDLEMSLTETFDMIISNLVLMDLANLDKAIGELHRVLKKKGKLIFSIMHPCFSSPPTHGWVRMPHDTDRKEDRIYWKVDRYFDRTMETWRYFDWPPVYSFHRPLSDYIKTLVRNGFTITNFEEPIPSKKAMKEHYREFGNEYDRVLWFLIIGAKKA